MKNVTSKFLAKLTMVILIICTMLFSSIAPIISFAIEKSENAEKVNDEYVKFELNWGDLAQGGTEALVDNGTATAFFDLQFDTISEFKNFRIVVEKQDLVKVDFNTKSEYLGASSSISQTQYLKNITAGTKVSGEIKFTFGNNSSFEDYTRNLVIKLLGTYELNGEEIEVELTRNLIANVKSIAIISNHNAKINEYKIRSSNPNLTSNTSTLYSVNKISEQYEIIITSENAQYTKLEFEFYRNNTNSNNTYYPNKVILSNTNPNNTFNLTKIENKEGTYIVEKGEEQAEYKEDSLYRLNEILFIDVEYEIANPEQEVATTTVSNVKLISKGFTSTSDKDGITHEKNEVVKNNQTSKYYSLYRYTPNAETWGKSSIDTKLPEYNYNKNSLIEFVENGKLELPFETSFQYVQGKDIEGTAQIDLSNGEILYYKKDTYNYETKVLNNNIMYVKSIQVNSMPEDNDAWIKFYKEGESDPFFTATKNNLKYSVSESEKIGQYYAVANNILVYKYSGWNTIYELSASELQKDGFTKEQILNIRNITKSQSISGKNMSIAQYSAKYVIPDFEKTSISHIDVMPDVTMNANISEVNKEVKDNIKLYFGTDKMGDNAKDVYVKNTNPIIYVKLPNCFDFNIYDFKFNSENNIYVDDWKINNVNGEKVLEIKCKGSINSLKEDVQLTIDYGRKLKPNVMQKTGNIDVFMKTDEDKYYKSKTDSYDFDNDGDIQDKLSYTSLKFSIDYNAQISLSNLAYSASQELKENETIYLEKGKTVKYSVTFNNFNQNMDNINIISRLPFEGNKSIKGDNLIDLGSTISLGNVKNIKVYEKTFGITTPSEININNYEILYSKEETANFETEFTNTEEDINNAKNIQIKFKNNYILMKDRQIIIEYECDIPDDVQDGDIAFQTSAVKYQKSGEENVQEASPMKVEVGSPSGKIDIVTTFEGKENKPSVQGIEFKLVNMDDETKFYTQTTNAEGIAIFNNVPVGDWEIVKLTNFENYTKPISPRYIKISNKEQYTKENNKSINYENKVKKSRIEIINTLENTNDIPKDNVEFELKGTTVAGDTKKIENMKTFIEEDEFGNEVSKAVVFAPYGNYEIRKIKGLYGWYSEDKQIEAKNEETKVTIINKITKGNLKIIKTMPKGDLVEGLGFRITGIGDVYYTNEQGAQVTFETDKTITISEDEKNAQIQISEDKRRAEIIVNDLPIGTYKIEEINMPKIDTESGEVTKYANVCKYVKLPDINNETTTITLENRHRQGTLDITVTADEGVDLQEFKVKVSGTNYYNKYYEEEFDVPETGKFSVKDLDIGKYNVEQVGTKKVGDKIFSTNPDGFEVTYNLRAANEFEIEIKEKENAKVQISNKYTRTGIVKIQSSLGNNEDLSDLQGVTFQIIGKDLTGKDIKETITIGKDGIGTSNEIPVGTYLLTQLEGTVPEKYIEIEDREITISSENTVENPLILPIENKLAEGNIIMETETENGNYPEECVTYMVTKVDDNLQAIDKSIEVKGNDKSYAKLENLEAGKYIVEQKTVPEGYVKGPKQVVEITRNGYGYAFFVIEKENKTEEINNTKVVINKELLNEQGEIATKEDFENAKIDDEENCSFEVKLRNIDTKETFYSFVDNKKVDTIVGLPYGTYEIEEAYKPKFTILEIAGENVLKDEENSKYKFTLSEETNKIELTIKNKINTNFGFGGQDYKNSLYKTVAEPKVLTKNIIYVRDEEENKVDDATFKVYKINENGEALETAMKFAGNNGVYIPVEDGNEILKTSNGQIILKTLEVGKYKLVNDSVNEKYVKPSDKIITVYKNEVGVTKVQLLKNTPRGSIRLSTTYTSEDGEEKYAPRSKYKILDPETEELLTFVKNADGTYERSNLPNAINVISLKAGYTDVLGIEAEKTYKVGIVDLTEKYGVIKEEAEVVEVEEATKQEVNVKVEERSGVFTKVVTDGRLYIVAALDKEGKIWYANEISGTQLFSDKDKKTLCKLQCLSDDSSKTIINDVKFKDISTIPYKVIKYGGSQINGLDEEGNIWINIESNPTCISKQPGNPLCDNNIKIKQLLTSNSSTMSNAFFALDEEGKIWFWGSFNQQREGWLPSTETPICMSDLCDLKDVTITKLSDSSYNTIFAIDNRGKIWSWGAAYYGEAGFDCKTDYCEPTCISDIEGSNIKDVKIKKVAGAYGTSFFIDTENKLWVCGSGFNGLLGNGVEVDRSGFANSNSYVKNPICLNYNNPDNPLNGIGIIDISTQYYYAAAIDENGKLWTWGQDTIVTSRLGKGNLSEDKYEIYPICITSLDNNELDEVKLTKVCAGYHNVSAAIDSNGDIWTWGMYPPTEYNAQFQKTVPLRIAKAQNSHFTLQKFVKVDAGVSTSAGIDENGRVWMWGYDHSNDRYTDHNILGNYVIRDNGYTSIPVLVGGDNSKIYNEKIVDISLGGGEATCQTLALDSNGKVWIWGQISYVITNWLNSGISHINIPICLSDKKCEENILYGKKITKIASGNNHAIGVIDEEGKLYVLKGEDTEMSCLNDKYPELNDVVFTDIKLSKNANNAIALDNNGNVYTWGNNEYGQCGVPRNHNAVTNRVIEKPLCISKEEGNSLYGVKIKQVSIGKNGLNGNHCLAIDEEGKIYAWGYNLNGELGDGTTTNTDSAICLTTMQGNELYGKVITKVEAGRNMSLAVDEEGKIYTWGSNSDGNGSYGQLGQGVSTWNIGNNDKYPNPTCINDDIKLDVKDVSLGTGYGLAVDKNNDIWSWGSSQYGKNGRTQDTSRPLKLQGKTYEKDTKYGKKYDSISRVGNLSKQQGIAYENNIKQEVTIGDYITLTLDNDGNVYTYGNNFTGGILGDGTTSPRQEPKCINNMLGNKKIKEVYMDFQSAAIAIDEDGGVWTWGIEKNIRGLGNQTAPLTPTCISEGKFVVDKVLYCRTYNGSTGPLGVILQDTEGNIWTWGSNSYITGVSGSVLEPTCINKGKFEVDKIVMCNTNTQNGPIMTIVQSTEGDLWAWGQGRVTTLTNVTANVNSKITEIISVELPRVLFKDEEGKVWIWCYTNSAEPVCINGNNDIEIENVIVAYDTMRPIIVQDTEGNLCHIYNGVVNIMPKIKIKIKKFITQKGTNMAQYVQDTEGKIWKIGLSGVTCINEGNIFEIEKIIASPDENTNTVNYSNIEDTVILQDTQGRIWSWGGNNYGQCGTGNTETVTVPTCINVNENNEVLFTIEKVILSGYTNVVQDTEGRIWTWGYNNYGQCGTGDKQNVLTPTCINENNKFKIREIISTASNTIILQDTEGKIWSFGANSIGKLINKEYVPVCINDLYNIDKSEAKLVAGSCNMIITKNGDCLFWTNNMEPIKLNTLDKIKGKAIKEVQIASENGTTYLFILTKDGNLYKAPYSTNSIGDVEAICEREFTGNILGTGEWTNDFVLLKDNKYAN